MEKKLHPFDDFLKEKLKGHQLAPRDEARKAFLEEAAAIGRGRGGRRGWLYILPLLLIITGSIALLVYLNRDYVTRPDIQGSDEDTPRNNDIIALEKSAPELFQSDESRTALSSVDSLITKSAIVIPATPEVETLTLSSGAFTSPDQSQDLPLISGEPKVSVSRHAQSFYLTSLPYIPDIQAGILKYSRQEMIRTAFADDVREKEPEISEIVADPGKSPLIITGSSYYAPEWMFNTIEGGKYLHNFGFDITFYKGQTSVRTGLGISVSKGVTENSVAYNEYLGTFNKLDSITFAFDEETFDFYPEVYTSSQTVWDSLTQYDSNEIVKRYTYLQVPFVLGFDFMQKGDLILGVRIGTVMSLMLKSSQLSGTYEAGSNLVLGLQKISPDQLSINWQAVGGINTRYLINQKLFIEIEPQLKYYYSSIYEKSGYTKKPWSVGARFAVGIRF